MDKKIRNRILYITVAVLWSVAIYRTYKNYNVESIEETETNFGTPGISPISFRKDSFDLVLPEVDPFLHESRPLVSYENQNNAIRTNEVKKIEIQPQIEKKIWPQIDYFGFVKNRNQNSTLCLLKVNGKQMQVSKGGLFEGIILLQAAADSVVLKYENEVKSIYKKS